MITRSMEGSQDGREILQEIAGKKSTILDEADQLTSKYRGLSSEDVTSMLSKRVTDEILYGNQK